MASTSTSSDFAGSTFRVYPKGRFIDHPAVEARGVLAHTRTPNGQYDGGYLTCKDENEWDNPEEIMDEGTFMVDYAENNVHGMVATGKTGSNYYDTSGANTDRRACYPDNTVYNVMAQANERAATWHSRHLNRFTDPLMQEDTRDETPLNDERHAAAVYNNVVAEALRAGRVRDRDAPDDDDVAAPPDDDAAFPHFFAVDPVVAPPAHDGEAPADDAVVAAPPPAADDGVANDGVANDLAIIGNFEDNSVQNAAGYYLGNRQPYTLGEIAAARTIFEHTSDVVNPTRMQDRRLGLHYVEDARQCERTIAMARQKLQIFMDILSSITDDQHGARHGTPRQSLFSTMDAIARRIEENPPNINLEEYLEEHQWEEPHLDGFYTNPAVRNYRNRRRQIQQHLDYLLNRVADLQVRSREFYDPDLPDENRQGPAEIMRTLIDTQRAAGRVDIVNLHTVLQDMRRSVRLFQSMVDDFASEVVGLDEVFAMIFESLMQYDLPDEPWVRPLL
jgi:hypothetical protein